MTVTCRPYKFKKSLGISRFLHWCDFTVLKEGGYLCQRDLPLTPVFWVECVKSISFLPQTLTPIYHATCSEPETYQNKSDSSHSW